VRVQQTGCRQRALETHDAHGRSIASAQSLGARVPARDDVVLGARQLPQGFAADLAAHQRVIVLVGKKKVHRLHLLERISQEAPQAGATDYVAVVVENLT
jgi:hypothetical protein